MSIVGSMEPQIIKDISQAIGQYAITSEPRKTETGFDDRSFWYEPILVTNVSVSIVEFKTLNNNHKRKKNKSRMDRYSWMIVNKDFHRKIPDKKELV